MTDLIVATVGSVTSSGISLIIPPATTASEKLYKRLGTSESIAAGNMVLCAKIDGTYVVLGKVDVKSSGGGGGGTADALPLAGGTMEGAINMDGNKVSNLPTPSANGDAVPKSYVDSNYRTAAAQDAIDAAQDAEIGIVITGKRPSMAVTAGQYVIVRNSTISGISDGLYTANAALSPSTDVTAADLTAVSDGGLNNLIGRMPLFRTHSVGSEPIVAGETRTITYTIPSIAGYTPHVTSVHIPDTSNINYAKVFMVWHQSGTTLSAHVFNTSSAQVAPSPRVECLYLPT